MQNFLEKLLLDSGLPAPAAQIVILALSIFAIAVLAYLVSRLTIHLMIPFFCSGNDPEQVRLGRSVGQ